MSRNKKDMKGSDRKTYVLDTNILLRDPKAIFNFKENTVVIPMPVLEEVDTFKKGHREVNYNARNLSRTLMELMEKGKLRDGLVMNKEGGKLQVAFQQDISWSEHLSTDDKILQTILKLKEDKNNNNVILISKDNILRIKANGLGIDTEDYETDKVPEADFYAGYQRIESQEIFNSFRENHYVDLKNIAPARKFHPNEFLIIAPSKEEGVALGRYDSRQKRIVALQFDQNQVYGIKAENLEQRMALELLLNDDIQLVTLAGRAGTGKTLLTLATALQKIEAENSPYRRIIVYRPIIPVGGKDLGALPGGLDEKLNPWMEAIDDNLEFLMYHHKNGKKNMEKYQDENGKLKLDQIFKGRIEKKALIHIRGRSIPQAIVIIDEAQNLTPDEIKTITTRVSEHTKIIFTGDPDQIDYPFLDKYSNGLIHLISKMKGFESAGHVTLIKSVRGKLAEYAAKNL